MEEPKLIKTRVLPDERGWFMEAFNRDSMIGEGIDRDWFQDNVSRSKSGVIRGIHYQLDGQAKLVRCLVGKIVDVVVDLRMGSSGRCYGFSMDGNNMEMLYVPPGFGHSFIAVEESIVSYKVDTPWNPELERGIRFDDPQLAIPWGTFVSGEFIVSEKDMNLPFSENADFGFRCCPWS